MRTMREEENHNKVEQPRKLVKGWDFSSHYTCHHKKKEQKGPYQREERKLTQVMARGKGEEA